MLHLSPERLAAIADDEPTAAEAMHLAGCADCTHERMAHVNVLASAQLMRLSAETPVSDWNSLRSRLLDEGVIRSPVVRGVEGPVVQRRLLLRRAGLLAAGLALVVGGAAGGRASAGAALIPQGYASAPREVVVDEAEPFTSTAEALNVYLRSQREFQRSAAYLAANDETPESSRSSVLTRLAALEEMYSASMAGLREAPTDPVLNDYYVSVLSAREATRRQLNRLIPVGMQRERW